MKGVVFTLFERFVTENWGEDTYEDLLDAAPVVEDSAFVSVQSYPDEWLFAMVGVACDKLEVDAATALRSFGRYCFSKLVDAHPVFVEDVAHPKAFLMKVHDVVHVEVNKLMPGAVTPTLLARDTGPFSVEVTYRSPRAICAFAEGLMEGCAEWYGVPFTYEHLTCTHRGDETCTWKVRYEVAWQTAV